jgi:hypothetical protein
VPTRNSVPDIENAGPESHDECQSCIERALENASLKDAAEKEVETIKTALQVLEGENVKIVLQKLNPHDYLIDSLRRSKRRTPQKGGARTSEDVGSFSVAG